jgi:hypothetical protein
LLVRAEQERDAAAQAHRDSGAELADLRKTAAGLASERDAARHALDAERAHSVERLTDQRAAHEERLAELRADRDAARDAARAAERQADAVTAELAAARRVSQ